MEYNLGRGAGSGRGEQHDVDPKIVAQFVKTMAEMRSELARTVEPLFEAIRNLQPTIDVYNEAFAVVRNTLAPLYARMPQNWPPPPNGEDLTEFHEVLLEGIPLAYVPGFQTVTALVEAPDYDSRLAVLMNCVADVIDDCRQALHERSLHPAVENLQVLVNDALAALGSGHHASAQALATCVADTVLHNTLQTRRYLNIVERIKSADLDEALYSGVYRFELALQPVIAFLDGWDSLSGEPPPRRLSRTATVHGATSEHFTHGNAIIAVLLATSLVLGASEWNLVGDEVH